MMGDDLAEIRARLEGLATPDGRFVVACARTGERPVPVAGLRFADRATAAHALDLASSYRETLAEYDPRAPRYDLVVHEAPGLPRTDRTDGLDQTDACHEVVGAVFEALAAAGHEAAERAVLDGYLSAAETTTDPNDLSVVLLAAAASALDAHLSRTARASVLRDAAARVDLAPPDGTPADALHAVASADLARTVTRAPDGWRFEPVARTDDGAVTLPVTVALLATDPDADPAFEPVAGRVAVSTDGGPSGLATVPA